MLVQRTSTTTFFHWLPWFWGRVRVPCEVGVSKISLSRLTTIDTGNFDFQSDLLIFLQLGAWKKTPSSSGVFLQKKKNDGFGSPSSAGNQFFGIQVWKFFCGTALGFFSVALFSKIYRKKNNRLWFATPWKKTECINEDNMTHRNSPTKKRVFHDTGCLRGILIMVYYNLHITG